MIFQDMLKHDPEYYEFLFDEGEKELIASMVRREKSERITIEEVLSQLESTKGFTFSKEDGLKNENGEKVETHPEDQMILDLLKFFEEFDSYEDIEINYQVEQQELKIKESDQFSEKSKDRLLKRLNLVKKQLYHKYDHAEFEYTRGPMIIDDIQ